MMPDKNLNEPDEFSLRIRRILRDEKASKMWYLHIDSLGGQAAIGRALHENNNEAIKDFLKLISRCEALI